MASLIGVIIWIVIMAVIFSIFSVMLVRLWLRFYNVKNCVEVEVFEIGDKFTKKQTYNCKKSKKRAQGVEKYLLTNFWAKKEFVFYEEYATTRQSDGKTCLSFILFEGKHAPFLPGVKLTTDAKTGDVTSCETYIPKENFSKKFMDEIVEDSLKTGYEKFAKLGEKKKGGIMFAVLMALAAVAVLIGLLYFMTKK